MSIDQSWLDRYRDDFLKRSGGANTPRAGSAGSISALTAEPESPTPPTGYQYVPNYMQILQSDPNYLDWLNSGSFDLGAAGAARKAALQSLVIRYGGLGGFKDTYGDIDQATLDLAANNPYSDTKRIQRGYEQGVEQYKRGLAGRRMLRSGSLQHGLDQADYGRGASEYDLANEYGNAVQMAINNYLGVENAFRRSQADAIRQAAAAGAPIYQPTGPGPSGGGTGGTTSTDTASAPLSESDSWTYYEPDDENLLLKPWMFGN